MSYSYRDSDYVNIEIVVANTDSELIRVRKDEIGKKYIPIKNSRLYMQRPVAWGPPPTRSRKKTSPIEAGDDLLMLM